MLTAVPKVNVQIGPIPLYMIDVLIGVCLLRSMRLPREYRWRMPFQGLLGTLFFFAILSEGAGVVYSGEILQPLYMAGRTTLAFLVVFITVRLVRGPEEVEIVLKAAVAGLLVTGSLMVLSSLPMTRSIANIFFSISFLEPAARSVAAAYAEYGDYGVRGRTLVGVSIMGATYINALWPLAALFLVWKRRAGVWRMLAIAACTLAPFAVLMSYSRGPILGSILIVLATLFLGIKSLRGGILRPVLTALVLVMIVGVGSQVFFFDRLVNRTEAIFDDPMADDREAERLLAYVDPFSHLAENPQFMFLGEGVGIQKTGQPFENAGRPDHAVFAKAYYVRGMISAVLYMILIVSAVLLALRNCSRASDRRTQAFSAAALLAMIAMLPWAVFGHAIVSMPRGAMMFFFVLGIVAVANRFAAATRQQDQGRQVVDDRRHPAFR